MAAKCVKRITMFKVAKAADIKTILAQYEVMRNTAVKDGKPYILSLDVGEVYNTEEARSQGYTVAVESTFASREDVKYYDTECEGHKAFKAVATPLHNGVLTALFDSERP